MDEAVIHEEDTGTHVAGEFHLMCDDEHGHPFFGQLSDDAEHFPHHGRVQGGSGLVEENDFGLHGQAPGDGHTLFLTAGEAFRIDLGLFGQAHFAQECHGLSPRLLQADFLDFAGSVHHVLQHGHVVEEIESLEYHAHFLAHLVHRIALREYVLPVHEYASARGRIQQVHRTQQGAFACSGRSDDADDLTGQDVAVYILQDGQAATVRIVIGFAEVGYGNHSTFFRG